MERLYLLQDDVQDWLVPSAHLSDSWPRSVSWSQDGLIAYCLPFGRHSGKENVALSYPIFVCSFNFPDSRITVETPHTTPIRFLQFAPLSAGRLLLSADDTTVCIWQFGETIAQCHCIDTVQLFLPVLVTWLGCDEPRISTLSNTPSATFDTRLGEAARSAARTLACITRAIFDTIASPLPRGLNPYPIGPGIDGCKDAWIGVATSGHVVISSQQAPDAAFMTARYHVAPNGAVAAELSYMNARPILALVSTYANTVSLYELNGDRSTLLVMSATCIARLVLEPTIRVLAIRSNPYLPAQFVLLTADAIDSVPRLEMYEAVGDMLLSGPPVFTRLAGPVTHLDATSIEFVAPSLIAVTSRTGAVAIVSRELTTVAQEKTSTIVACARSPNHACMAALDANGALSVWRIPAHGSNAVLNRFAVASLLGADPSDLLVALQSSPMQDTLELQALLMEPLSSAHKAYFSFHVDAFKSSVARLIAGPEAQVPAQARLSLAFVLDALRSCMIKPFSLPTGHEIWSSNPPQTTEALYKAASATQALYIVDHAALPTLYQLTEWVLDFAVYLLKSAYLAAGMQRDNGPMNPPLQNPDLPVPRSVEACFILYGRSLPRLSPAIIMLYDDDIRNTLLELLVICHNVREQFSQRKLLPPKHSSYGTPMLKALHELLMTLYTKARLTASPTLETLPQALQNLCTEIASLTLPAVLDPQELDPARLFATLDLIAPALPFVTTLPSPTTEGDALMFEVNVRECARDVVSRTPLTRDDMRRQRMCSRCGRVAAEQSDGKLLGVVEAPWPARWAFCCPLCGGRWIPGGP